MGGHDFDDGQPLKEPGHNAAGIWERLPYRCDTGGVIPMELEGRNRWRRERCRGMTDEERAWRKKWLNAQVLDDDEPLRIDAIYKELRNPIRRFYLWPANKFQLALERVTTPAKARITRWITFKMLQCVAITYFMTYYGLYRLNDWETMARMKVTTNHPVLLPGDPGFPFVSKRTRKDDYLEEGFKKSFFFHMYDQDEKKPGVLENLKMRRY